MAGLDDSEREQELYALSEIYPSSEFRRVPNEFSAHVYVSPNIPEGVEVRFTDAAACDGARAASKLANLSVSHLAPNELRFDLPEDYPLKSPPHYSLTCKWLTPKQLAKLCVNMDSMWTEDSGVVIFQWVQFLQDEALDFLSVGTFGPAGCSMSVEVAHPGTPGAAVDDLRVCQDVASLSKLRQALLVHDEEKCAMAFASSSHDCEVCYCSKAGSECVQLLPCRHAFCRDCVRSYCEVSISDGAVTSLRCLTHDCDSPVLPTQVKEVVSRELYEKYDRLLLQRGLELMDEIVLCPAQRCQKPVVKDGGDSNMATCSVCRLSFCVLCRRVWHGVNPCAVTNKDRARLAKAYTDGTEAERDALLARYGNRIKRYAEEEISESWLSENSKACPTCGCHIQKTHGCNKMTCTRCRNNFCWMCKANLNRSNPYRHFGDQSSPCYNRLFDGVVEGGEGEDDGDEEDFLRDWMI